MKTALLIVLGVIALAAVGYALYVRRETAEEVAARAAAAAKLVKRIGELEGAVVGLHAALFMGAGIPVWPIFNKLWRICELEERGVPPIDDKGRT